MTLVIPDIPNPKFLGNSAAEIRIASSSYHNRGIL